MPHTIHLWQLILAISLIEVVLNAGVVFLGWTYHKAKQKRGETIILTRVVPKSQTPTKIENIHERSTPEFTVIDGSVFKRDDQGRYVEAYPANY